MENISSYTPPEILNDMDENTIRMRMLENLPGDIDKTEGGFASDFTFPAAIEKADAMIALNEIVQIFFPEWAYGQYLDMHARAAGLSRKLATAASGTLKVTGVEGTVIPKGFKFSVPATAITPNIEYETLEDAVIPGDTSNRTVYINIQCTEAGTVGNVPQNSVKLMSSPIGGIAEITNEAEITGGTEEETDDALRERIAEIDERGGESFVGNDADYIRWAKEVEGVGEALVVPEWKGSGTGTVKIIVMDSTGSPAADSILTAVYNHIISPDDRTQRLAPIGAILTVTTAEAVSVNVSAAILLEEGATMTEVTAAFKTALKAYFTEAKKEGALRYTRVCSVLSETSGVLDYSSSLLNNGTENISIDADDYPTVGQITFTEAVS